MADTDTDEGVALAIMTAASELNRLSGVAQARGLMVGINTYPLTQLGRPQRDLIQVSVMKPLVASHIREIGPESEADLIGRLQDQVRHRAREIFDMPSRERPPLTIAKEELVEHGCIRAAAAEILGDAWDWDFMESMAGPVEIAITGRR